MFEAGLMADAYPLRQQDASQGGGVRHSRPCRRRDRRCLARQYAIFLAQLKDGHSTEALAVQALVLSESAPLSCRRIALSFAQFSKAFHGAHGVYPDIRHIESAHALLHRRIEQVPARADRVMIAGLAATALASSGLRTHLVVDSDLAIPYLNKILVPLYQQLGLTVGVVEADMPEAVRRGAYAAAITIVSARECAMDFLRDAVNWPQRSDRVYRKVDQLLGKRGRQASNIMRGLPCAILLDADSTLIDNARTPIALTRDAHPMYEVEALKQALEMVTHLQRGQHYELTGERAEVELTDLGQRQLLAWTEQLQGVWNIESIAQRMLLIAIVVSTLIRAGTHYRVSAQAIEWTVDERLVPGMAYYGKDFLSRVAALRDGLETNEQREVAARASYQQIFNRYVHVCGTCHSTGLIEPELQKVYGLKCRNRWPSVELTPFHQTSLSGNIEQKIEHLKSMLSTRPADAVSVILTYDAKLLAGLQNALQETIPGIAVLDADGVTQASACLQAGSVWLAQQTAFEHLAPLLEMPAEISLTFVVLQRSARYSEDRRNLFWMQMPPFENARWLQLLSLDDELFAESTARCLKNMVGFSGSGWGARKLERRIAKMQRNKAQALVRVRRQLLSHDTTMQGLLSFSGRGLYE